MYADKGGVCLWKDPEEGREIIFIVSTPGVRWKEKSFSISSLGDEKPSANQAIGTPYMIDFSSLPSGSVPHIVRYRIVPELGPGPRWRARRRDRAGA